jgi:crotonobetainyl-CoA:carnitine CoA-transferase CaiB-like acyl-CoA transferase
MSLDLRSTEGLQVFRELVRVSDVVVENFTPGTMERLGLSYSALKEINPSLIYAAISGYGQLEPYVGPYKDWAANNATVQAMGGLMELSRVPDGPPVMVGATVGDTIPGLWAALSIVAAIHHRGSTGQGQFLDVAMYDCMAAMCYQSIASFHVTGSLPNRSSDGQGVTFTGTLPCNDGHIAVSMWGNRSEQWTRMWGEIGRADLVGDTEADPVRPGGRGTFADIRQALEAWLTDLSKVDAVRAILDFGFSAGMVQTAEDVYNCPHLEARQLFMDVDDGLGGVVRAIGVPTKFSGFQARPPMKAPSLGEHNEVTLTTLLGH